MTYIKWLWLQLVLFVAECRCRYWRIVVTGQIRLHSKADTAAQVRLTTAQVDRIIARTRLQGVFLSGE